MKYKKKLANLKNDFNIDSEFYINYNPNDN